jgi:hypothetical protein
MIWETIWRMGSPRVLARLGYEMTIRYTSTVAEYIIPDSTL